MLPFVRVQEVDAFVDDLRFQSFLVARPIDPERSADKSAIFVNVDGHGTELIIHHREEDGLVLLGLELASPLHIRPEPELNCVEFLRLDADGLREACALAVEIHLVELRVGTRNAVPLRFSRFKLAVAGLTRVIDLRWHFLVQPAESG